MQQVERDDNMPSKPRSQATNSTKRRRRPRTAKIINFKRARAKHARAVDARAIARMDEARLKRVRDRVARVRQYVELLDQYAATGGENGLDWVELIDLPGLEAEIRKSEARLEYIRLRMSGK
jgi:hypothetical protein